MHDARHDPATDGEPGAPRGYSVVDDWALRNGRADGHKLYGPADLHPLTDIDALRQLCQELRQLCQQQADALDYLARRVEALEADGRTWRATLETHGDALQTLMLRGTP